jgi:hypothetical protein
MANLKPPKVDDKLVPVFTEDELIAMLATCKGGGFQNRRDYAVISLFKDVGNGSSTPKTASACTWHSPRTLRRRPDICGPHTAAARTSGRPSRRWQPFRTAWVTVFALKSRCPQRASPVLGSGCRAHGRPRRER